MQDRGKGKAAAVRIIIQKIAYIPQSELVGEVRAVKSQGRTAFNFQMRRDLAGEYDDAAPEESGTAK